MEKAKLRFSLVAIVCIAASNIFNAHCVAAEDLNQNSLFGSCKHITLLPSKAEETNLQFSSVIPQVEVGYSVEFIFNGDLSDFQADANLTALNPAVVSKVSKSHWIVSVAKTKKLEVKKAEFEVQYQSLSNAELVGIILNAKVLCGGGESKIYTSESQIYDGHKKCKANIKARYEHETALTIEEQFSSKRVGLVVDVVFDSEIDSLEPGAKFFPKKHSKRHYSLINSGYITSEGEPVLVDLSIVHRGKPTPGISTVIMNDVALCGFAPSHHVFDHNALSPIATLLDVDEESLNALKTLILSTNIISGCALLVAVVTGVFAWRLTRPEEKEVPEEPMYARPNKY